MSVFVWVFGRLPGTRDRVHGGRLRKPTRPSHTTQATPWQTSSRTASACPFGKAEIFEPEADDRLLRLRFAIIIAPGNLRPCRGQSYVPVFGLLLPDRTRIPSQRERGSGR
jgi:hypothetical protein